MANAKRDGDPVRRLASAVLLQACQDAVDDWAPSTAARAAGSAWCATSWRVAGKPGSYEPSATNPHNRGRKSPLKTVAIYMLTDPPNFYAAFSGPVMPWQITGYEWTNGRLSQ